VVAWSMKPVAFSLTLFVIGCCPARYPTSCHVLGWWENGRYYQLCQEDLAAWLRAKYHESGQAR
jgi:hypothetical protein